MIELPRRSVTRFFIPLIDVLVVMFGIFLLMPAMSQTAPDLPGGEASDLPTPPAATDPSDPEALARLLHLARLDVERLKREKAEALEHLSVQVLEIDGATGKLYSGTGPERVEVAREAQAHSLVDSLRNRRENAGRELYFLFLLPRTVSSFPTQGQIDTYRRWFAGVPSGFDNPNPAH